MNISRQVALSLGLGAFGGAALMLSLRSASGQPSTPPAAPVPAVPAAPSVAGASPSASATPSPFLPQTIGISPANSNRQKGFNLFGNAGGGGESYDLQSRNVYGLLEQRGVYDQRTIPHRSVLDPESTTKSSFIIERLIVLSLTGSSAKGNNAPTTAAPAAPPTGTRPGAAPTGAAPANAPTDAELTVSAVRRVVDIEISRGSGRIGGTHRRKLQFLDKAIRSLEQANQIGGAVATAVAGAGGQTAINPREVFYGNARQYARAADQLTPKGF